MQRVYEWRHGVTFAETNLLGNVYFSHFVAWQGACREAFLGDHAPEILAELGRGLVLSTARCSCVYHVELAALDTVVLRMRLGGVVWNRLTLRFEYWREREGELERVADGEQEIVCRQREGGEVTDREIPRVLLDALEPYREGMP